MAATRQAGIVVGRFCLDRKLGEGGMGEVWSATHVQTRKSVALKFLKHEGENDPLRSRRFLREARAASAVRHPNVVQIHDALQLPDGDCVIVMDLLQGEDLGQLLERRGALPVVEVATLLMPVLEALLAAHKAGIVHRDLKPENIFLDQPMPGRIQPKVLDFGIAKLTAQAGPAEQSMQLTNTGTVMGSPYYMSPEQIYGEADLDARSDVWALGVILYECLSGRKPFIGDNYGQLFKAITLGQYTPLVLHMPHLPQPILELVAGMLQTERSLRAADLSLVLGALGGFAGGQGIALSDAGARSTERESARDYSEASTGPTQMMTAETPVALTRTAAQIPQKAGRGALWRLATVFTLASAGGLWWALGAPTGQDELPAALSGNAALSPDTVSDVNPELSTLAGTTLGANGPGSSEVLPSSGASVPLPSAAPSSGLQDNAPTTTPPRNSAPNGSTRMPAAAGRRSEAPRSAPPASTPSPAAPQLPSPTPPGQLPGSVVSEAPF